MNTLLIISILITVISLGMYWKAKKEVITVEKDRDHWMTRQSDEQKINLFMSSEIEKIRSEFNSQSDELEKEKEKSKNLSWLINDQYKPDIQKLREELANLQRIFLDSVVHNEAKDKRFDPVKTDEFPFQYRTFIDWSDIEISISDLIEDVKLYEVFVSLLNSNLLPKSITNSIDYNVGDGQVIIYTQEFNEEGEEIRALTWREITDQILSKKQIVTDYLKNVIQDSDRAMVVHNALNAPKRKEVAA